MSQNHLTWEEALNSSPGPREKKEYLILYIKAFIMGIADLIPGVSGGTIAFITGIYESLLDAVASLNKELLVDLIKLDFKSLLSKVHVRFIAIVGIGILSAIFSLASVMHYLINNHPIPTWAAFFGLIGASIIVIYRHLDGVKNISTYLMILVGAVVAYITVSLIPVDTPYDYWFIYLCGVIGITAMILPGISGSFLLLILGKYEYITGALKAPFNDGNMTLLIVFACGSATGLLGFSKTLNYFMKHHHSKTMAFLTGILIGSMKKMWPWKEVLETKIVRGKVRVLREANIWPEQIDGEFYLAVALIVLGFVTVLLLESKTKKKENNNQIGGVSSAG